MEKASNQKGSCKGVEGVKKDHVQASKVDRCSRDSKAGNFSYQKKAAKPMPAKLRQK
jgi:hypothetical protein